MIIWSHATLWESGNSGEAPMARHRSAETGAKPVSGGCQSRQFGEFCVSMARDFSRTRPAGTETAAGSGAPAQAERPSEAATDQDPCGRRPKLRLLHGPLDAKARGEGDPRALWDRLPPQPHVAIPPESGLERPEADKAGSGARREGHRALEALRLAAYKKRPNGLRLNSSFSTRAVFFSFLPSGGLGHPAAERRSCAPQDTGPRFRPARLSLSPQSANDWPFMPGSSRTKTSARPRRPGSCVNSPGTCAAPSSSSGTVEASTRGSRFASFARRIRSGRSIASLAMPLSSTRTSSSGLFLRGPWQTASPKITSSLNVCSTARSCDYDNPRNFFGPASMPRTCHGNSFHFLCVSQ